MSVTIKDERYFEECYSISERLANLALVSKRTPALFPSNYDNLQPLQVAVQLLRDVAILQGYHQANEGDCCYTGDDCDELEDCEDNRIESAEALIRRIQSNDPKLTSLAIQNVQILDRGRPTSFFRGFTQRSIQKATEALYSNHTIRSVSCCYDWNYPKRILHLLRHDEEGRSSDEYGGEDDSYEMRATSLNQLTKLQERRFFEACVCLPQLESISLTGGNRWRISHLLTTLETAKGLKKLTVRDVVIKSPTELNGLMQLFLLGSKIRNHYAPIALESIELTIEDQTDRTDEYWSTATRINTEETPFDGLLECLVSSPNMREIKISKSVLSRFRLRPSHEVSTKTLLKLAKCQSLKKLVLSGISVEEGGIEAMCESLIQQNGHLTDLEFYGCAFNHSVGQSGWNAMFRLIEHDPTMQIRASSLVYSQRKHQQRPTSSETNNSTILTSAREELELSTFVRRPRQDFSFSLRDEDGAKRHFRNRNLDVRYRLQEAGFFRLLRASRAHNTRNSDWIKVMSNVREDSIALFYILRENPALCDQGQRSRG